MLLRNVLRKNRVFTAVLTAAMIFTSVPAAPVMGAELLGDIDGNIAVSAEDDALVTAETLDIDENISLDDGSANMEIATDTFALESESVTPDTTTDGTTINTGEYTWVVDGVKYQYMNGHSPVGEPHTLDYMSPFSDWTLHASAGITGFRIVGLVLYDGTEVPLSDGDYEITVSGNNLADPISITGGAATAVFPSSEAEFDFTSGDVYITSERFAFDTYLNFVPFVSNNIIKSVTYQLDGESPEIWTYNEEDYPDESYVEVHTKKSVNVKVADSQINDTIDSSVYNISVNGVANDPVNGVDIPFTHWDDTEIPVVANINDGFNTGRLTIKTTSADIIKQVNFQYEGTNYTYDESTGEFSLSNVSSASENTIINDADIVDDYMYATAVDVTIADEDASKNPDGKYAYTVKYLDADGEIKEDITDCGTPVLGIPIKSSATTVEIGVKQVKFDSTVNATILSNNLIKSFNYNFDSDSPETHIISGNTVFSKTNASTITFDDFTPAEGVDPDSYFVVVKVGDQIDEWDGSALTYDIEADTTDIEIKAVPKVKITLSFNGIASKFETSGLQYYVGDTAHSLSFSGQTAEFYVRPEAQIMVDRIYSVSHYDFATIENASFNADKTRWVLGSFTEDAAFIITNKNYALSQNIVVSDSHDYPISVSFNELSGAVVDVDGNPYLADNDSEFTVVVKTLYSKAESPEYYYQLPYNKGSYSLKFVNSDNEEVAVRALRNNLDAGKYSIVLNTNDVFDVLAQGSVLTFKSALLRYAQTYTVTLMGDPARSVAANVMSDGLDQFSLPATAVSSSRSGVTNGTVYDITAKAAAGYKLNSVSIDKVVGGEHVITSASASDFESENGYSLTVDADTTVKFNTEAVYDISMRYKSDGEVIKPDSKGVYTFQSARAVIIDYVHGSDHATNTDLLMDGRSIVSGNSVIRTSTGFEISAGFCSIPTTETSFKFVSKDSGGNVIESSVVEITAKSDSDKNDDYKNAPRLKKSSVTLEVGGDSVVVDIVPGDGRAFRPYILKFNGSAGYYTIGDNCPMLSWEKGSLKVSVRAGLNVTDTSEPYYLVLADTSDQTSERGPSYDKDSSPAESGLYSVMKITVNDAVSGAKAPKVSITATTNNSLILSLGSSVKNTKLEGLAYAIKYTISGTKTGSPFKADGTYTATVPAIVTSYAVNLLKDRTTETDEQWEAMLIDGDPDAKVSVEVHMVQMNGDKVIASSDFATIKDQHTKKGGIFATKLSVKKTKGTVSKLFNSMNGSDNANMLKFTVDFGKTASVQLLDMSKTKITGPNGDLVKGTNWDYDENTHEFKIYSPFTPVGNILPVGDYVITATALTPNYIPVTATAKFKVYEGIGDVNISGSSYIYKLPNVKSTSEFVAECYAMSTGVAVKNKLSWTIEGVTDNAKAALASKDVTFKNGKFTIKKTFVPKNVVFDVKATANDFKGSTVTCTKRISIKTKVPANYELAFSKDALTYDTLPTSATVADLFDADLGTPDNKNYKYTTYIRLYESDGNHAIIPATFKVSGAKILEKYPADGMIKIGFAKLGDVKITATATDGSGRSFAGKSAKVVKITSNNGNMGWKLSDMKGTLIKTNVTGGVADESDMTVDCAIAMGDMIRLDVAGYADKKASFVPNSVSVKGGSLVKYKYYGDVYGIKPNAASTVITLKNTATKKSVKITLNNSAIMSTGTKMKITATSKADVKSGKKIYASMDFTEYYSNEAAYKSKGFKGYLSDNRITYTLGSSADYVLVSVEKDDAFNTIAGAVAKASEVGGVPVMVGNAYKINSKGGKFAIDFFDSVTKTFTIKPASYKIAITPVDSTGKAVAKAVQMQINAVKVTAYKTGLKSNVDMTKSTSANVVRNTGKNFITDAYFTGVLKKGSVKGVLNWFDKNFTMSAGKDEIKFIGKGNKEGTAATVTDKNELWGYAEYLYQGLDGAIKTDYVKLTVKAPKNGLAP